MSNIVINGTTYNGIESITVKDTAGSDVKYTKGDRPSGTIEITENGVHNVTNYESANVNVSCSSDLIDVDALPTENIEDDKVYRVSSKRVGEYYIFLQAEFELVSNMLPAFGFNEIQYISVTSIDKVSEPQISDSGVAYVYNDTSSYIGYIWTDASTRMTLGEFIGMMFSMAGMDVELPNKGVINDVSEMSEDGVYYVQDETKAQVGIPNSKKDKEIYYYDNAEWIKLNQLTKDKLVGIWQADYYDYYEYKVYFAFRMDNVIAIEPDDNSSLPNWTYEINESIVCITDANGNQSYYDYVINEHNQIKLINQDDPNISYTKHTAISIKPITVTENGTYKTTSDAIIGYSSVTVNVPTGGTDRLQWKCDNVKSLKYEFDGYTGSDLSILEGLDTSQVENMIQTFNGCNSITHIPVLNTSKVKTFNNMCYQCYLLEELFEIDTRVATNLSYMLSYCMALHTVRGIDLINKPNVSGIFNSCQKLTNLIVKNIQTDLQIGSRTSYGHLLTNASLLNTAQELWDNTDNALGGTRTLTMATASKTAIQSIYVKLVDVTDEMIAQDEYISNKKPCVECASTDEGAMTLEEYIIGKGWAIA